MSHTPKILNIDDFARVERVLRFKGTDYEVREISVQDFIDNLKAAEELEKTAKGKKTTAEEKLVMSEQVEVSIKHILHSVPDFPEDELRKLKVPAMTAIMQFIRGELDVTVGGGVAEGAITEEGGEKKA